MLSVDHMKCLHKDVIRASAVGVFTILRRIKRLLQMMALIMIVAFMTSVLYQNVHGLKDLEVCKWRRRQRQFLPKPKSKTSTSWAKRPKSYGNLYRNCVFISFLSLHFISLFSLIIYLWPSHLESLAIQSMMAIKHVRLTKWSIQ